MSDISPARVLSRRDVLTLSFGPMIGWSWVFLTGEWLRRAGILGALLAFAIGGSAVGNGAGLGSSWRAALLAGGQRTSLGT